jgi:hypothetical protein
LLRLQQADHPVMEEREALAAQVHLVALVVRTLLVPQVMQEA